MENILPTNRPTRCETVTVSRKQFDHTFTDDAAKVEDIAKNFAAFKAEIAPAVDKTFVMMKNKRVWFDRNNAALFPKFETGILQTRATNNQPTRNYSLIFEGFCFVPMTADEFRKSFTNGTGNPYLGVAGDFNFFPLNCYKRSMVLTEEIDGDGRTHVLSTSNNDFWWRDGDAVTIVPIYRLRGKNSAAMTYDEAFDAWLANNLIPEGLTAAQEERYKNFMTHGTKAKSVEKPKNTADNIAALKLALLNCDKIRADIQPYDERLLSDINRGHWELFETAADDGVQIQLPADEIFVARPPQLDVSLNGICAIDFGTKSTIVVCRDGEARMLRIGRGDYSKAPTMKDFENPTVIEFRDLKKFFAAYRAREGRPFTEWNQVTVSHRAAEAIFRDNVGSSVYNSVFSELKQWTKDEQSYPVLRDLSGAIWELKPYVDTRAIDDGDFDPIEIYAYYLGLYINNMHRKIYLDYILSFPVNYKRDIREKIRYSFERGLKKSLPPSLLHDEKFMKRFRVYLGASEPAAYAVTALEIFDLQPKTVADKVAYGVFDFGGGTTDFDFGVEYIPDNRRRNFIIEQFGSNGDALLGGENILELLAYDVYKANIDTMREKKIPFALPSGCEIFAGAETLVSRTRDAAAHMNNRTLSEKLRPIWENTDDRKNLTEDAQSLILFTNENAGDKVNVTLHIDAQRLEKLIEDRIRVGVTNFFESLSAAFEGKKIFPIHIFLAGNSCRSPFVKKIFDEFIDGDDEKFVLHMPPEIESPVESSAAEKSAPNVMELDMQRTGKTGVAFGLIRCRRGGKDVKIINFNDDTDSGEVNFPYFLGDAGIDGKTFTVKIGRRIAYNVWTYFTVADENEFELYYTTEARALQGDLPAAQVSMIPCLLDDEDVSNDEDAGVYIRKIAPNLIEYAVGRAEDFSGEFCGKIYRQEL